MNECIIKAAGLRKAYRNGEVETEVLKGIDLEIAKSEFCAIM